MNYEFLNRLYCACTDDTAGVPPFAEMYEHISEVETADAAFSERLREYPMSEQDDLNHLEITACLAYEKQGFINGFRLGMMLARELSGEEVIV